MVEKIRTGNSIIRNPILASYVAKGLLPYRRLGSGIKRALEAWPGIDFFDDREGCLFTAIVHRRPVKKTCEGSEKGSEKSSEKILDLLRSQPSLSAKEIAKAIEISPRAVEKHLAKLKEEGRLRRVGPAKGWIWEVLDKEAKDGI